MKHPFSVGGHYRNRVGDFEVVSIAEPKMTIRYPDGREVEVNIDIQARIWENIRLETVAADDDDAACVGTDGEPIPGAAFEGLKVSDFQQGAKGTCWRARSGLGGLLAYRLSEIVDQPFVAHAIFRRAQVHVVLPECYNREVSSRKAKLIFQLDPDQATFGYLIEKSDRAMDRSWDWRQFLRALRGNDDLQRLVWTAMREHELAWEILLSDSNLEDELLATISAGEEDLIWQWETREQMDQIGWVEFVDRLARLRRDAWADVYLCSHLTRGRAIAEGERISDRVVAIFAALLPLYQASTCPLS